MFLIDLMHSFGSRNRAHFEKLATATASVSQTSNTVSSLVICSDRPQPRAVDIKLRFVELVDLCSQDEIALRQTIDFVCPGRNPDVSPGKRDVWVVPLFLRKFAYAVYECEGHAKVGKREGLRNVVPLNHIPSVNLPLQRGEFLTL
jgi:hypothetical protein